MQGTAMIALSAAALGIAATSAFSTARGIGAPVAPRSFLAVNALIAGLAVIPLIIAFFPGIYPVYMPATLPMLLALPPAILIYISALTDGNSAMPPHHFILPLAGCLVALGYWVLPAGAREGMFVNGVLPPGRLSAILATSTFALIAIWTLGSFVYLFLVLKRLSAFRARLKDFYSNVETRELRWVEWLMAFLFAICAAGGLALVSDNVGPRLLFPGEGILGLTICLLLFLFATAPVKAPLRETTVKLDDKEENQTSTEKYARSALSTDHAKRLAVRIDAAMREQRLFLDPNLSLQKLSRQVGAAPHLISQTLNERLGSTFFDYVAGWRIDEAKRLILTDESSILTIAMEAGFNSKSTFYKAFKITTGMTPSDWRLARYTDSAPLAPRRKIQR